jgi:hypothetical protein
MTPDGLMIGFGAPGKCREHIVRNYAEIQLIKAAAAIGLEEGGQSMIAEADFIMAVEVPIVLL